MLQLRLGRSAHYYAVLISVALALDAFLVLFLPPNLTGAIPSRSVQTLFFLIFPLASGVYLSFVTLRLKWETYQLWPWELHFTLSLLSVGLSLLFAAIFVSNVSGWGLAAHWTLLPWFYPLSLAAISLPMASMGLTWPAWSRGKTTSVAAAVLPTPLGLVLLIPGLAPSSAVNLLAITLFLGAVMYQMSGSLLHLMASGSEAHELHAVEGRQGRLYALAEEIRNKEEAIRFRERAILKRESDLELAQTTISQERTGLVTAREEFDRTRAELDSRVENLSKQEREFAVKFAQSGALQTSLEDRIRAVSLREQESQRLVPKFQERENKIRTREAGAAQKESELTQRSATIDSREKALSESEARLAASRQQLEAQSSEFLKRSADASASPAPSAAATELASREARLTQLQRVLDEQNTVLGRKARDVESLTAKTQQQAADLGRREAAVRLAETNLQGRETEANDVRESALRQQKDYEGAIKELEVKRNDVARREAEIQARADELQRIGQTVQTRESALKQRETEFGSRSTSAASRDRDVAGQLKEVEARESDLALREQELERRLSGSARGSKISVDDSNRTLSVWENRLRQREEELNRREYDMAHRQTAAEGMLATPVVQRKPDRLPTGTPRLDDLLLGGLPTKGHVLLVGPTFSGKEMALYGFLAEGLKRGESVVLVTAGKSPDELSAEMGVVSPQFREYEQLGRVFWVDASNPAPDGGSSSQAPRRFVAKGAGDHPGILSNLVQASKAAEAVGRPFRVGFLGLSSCLTHSEDRRAIAFVPNLVGILKPRNALAWYTVDGGALPDNQVEAIQSRMDGTIRFKDERGKTYLQVQGLGDVATREWVEYRATNRALVVGSFSLERIR